MLIRHAGSAPRVDPTAYVAPNAVVCGDVTIGPGCRIMYGARVVQLKTHLAPGEIVPIGWVAVGNPAQVLPTGEHDRIWTVQQPLNFPLTVYGIDRSEATMEKITRQLSETLGSHFFDEPDV
jgi:carbonic anhydrase/acetyltransferase-like protein (isoleucine patch superfamily)